MSTAINSTHQQDRAAQQKLLNARQQAGAAGLPQGQAFAQTLSLACDEDTDLDAQQLGGKLWGLNSDSTGAEPGTSTARRKSGKGATAAGGDAATEIPAEGLHPAAQANASLLALLALAQGAPQAQTAATATDAEAAQEAAATGATSVLTGSTPQQGDGSVPVADGMPSEGKDIDPPPQVAPGKVARELARQLDAARRNGSSGTGATGSPTDSTPHWGRAATESSPSGAPGLPATTGPGAVADTQASAVPGGPATAAQATSASAGDGNSSDATGEGSEATAQRLAPDAVRSTGTDGQPGTGLGGEALGGTDLAERSAPAEEAAATAEQWQGPWAEAMDQVAQQISYWVGQGGVRQATLRVGSGMQQAMDVKLSMKNGRAEIEFRTDHEDARNAIAAGGTEVLRELLAHSGIDLGQVSVGAQNAGAGADGQAGQAAQGTPQDPQAAGTAPADTLLATQQPRHAASAGLDLYV